MDALLERLGAQAVNFAIRSGLALTSTYATRQCSRLLKTVNDKAIYAEIKALQKLLDSKIKILSPAIDLIEFKSGRGNVFLEGAVPLAKSLHREIVRLGKRLDDAASSEEGARLRGRKVRMSEAHYAELSSIISDMKSLLDRIDRDIPLIQLAISSSGEKLSSTLSPGISPSRMLQAGTLLSFGDAQFFSDPTRPVQIGPSFTLSLYMLFLGHSQAGIESSNKNTSLSSTQDPRENLSGQPYGIGEGERKPIWQEVMHKARVRICRTPPHWTFDSVKGYCPKSTRGSRLNGNGVSSSALALLDRPDEYAYHLEIIENLDDGRLHEDDGSHPRPFDSLHMAGLRESIPIHQVSKIFYTDTGRILNINNAADRENNPILLIKRAPNAEPPIRLREAWFDEAIASEYGSEDSTTLSDDQSDIDRQLREEAESPALSQATLLPPPRIANLPPHLDPEWLALEVYTEGDTESDSETEDEEDPDLGAIDGLSATSQSTSSPSWKCPRLSVDSNLVAQIRKISLQSVSTSATPSPLPSPAQEIISRTSDDSTDEAEDEEETVNTRPAKFPFDNIVSSLSLLEMLIRFTSLQEFQQTSYLSAPDYILNFFLEETSTTGLKGEARWQMRNKTKRHVGFDPYTDTPTK